MPVFYIYIYIYIFIYVIMKTICPPNYHHNGFVATHALWLHIAGTNEPKSAQHAKQGA